MIKKLKVILLAVFIISIIPIPTQAASVKNGWQVASKKVSKYTYGGWRNGPQGSGPKSKGEQTTIRMTNQSSKNYNISVTNTIEGSYTSKVKIGAAIGATLGKAITHAADYSVTLKNKGTYRIKYRPYYQHRKILEAYYKGGAKTGLKKNSQTKVYQNWDFTYIKL